MLEWTAEQVTVITMDHVELKFTPTATKVERGVPYLEFVLKQMHTARMALMSCQANDIVANSRKNPSEPWRRLQTRYGRATESYVSRF